MEDPTENVELIASMIRERIPFDIDITTSTDVFDIDEDELDTGTYWSCNIGYVNIDSHTGVECTDSYTNPYKVEVYGGCGGKRWDHVRKYEYEDIDDAVNKVVDVVERSKIFADKYEIISFKGKIDDIDEELMTAVENQRRQTEMISKILFHSETCTQGNTFPEVHEDGMDIVKYLLKLQDKCRDLLTTILEYKPDSEKVKSLEEDFNKLALTVKRDQ